MSRTLVASLKDKRPVYVLMGAYHQGSGTYGNQAKLGPMIQYCQHCDQRQRDLKHMAHVPLYDWETMREGDEGKKLTERELADADFTYLSGCYYSAVVKERVRKPNPKHCPTCKCTEEYELKNVRRRFLKPGHETRMGISWPFMLRFLKTFGTKFCEYWTTGSLAGNKVYRNREWREDVPFEKRRIIVNRRVRTTVPKSKRCAYAFHNRREAVAFVAIKAREFCQQPGLPISQPALMPTRVLAAQLEAAFWSWARLSSRRFVGRYRSS